MHIIHSPGLQADGHGFAEEARIGLKISGWFFVNIDKAALVQHMVDSFAGDILDQIRQNEIQVIINGKTGQNVPDLSSWSLGHYVVNWRRSVVITRLEIVLSEFS